MMVSVFLRRSAKGYELAGSRRTRLLGGRSNPVENSLIPPT